jgi:hypothetical protein
MNFELMMGRGKVGNYRLDETLSKLNSDIGYNPLTLQLAYIADFNTLKVSPLPHQDNLRFFGMGKKSEYLVCREYKNTFTAVHKSSKMTMWSTITGKVLAQGSKIDLGASSGNLDSNRLLGSSMLRDFKVYRANKEDKTWSSDYYRTDRSSLSLIVSLVPAIG